MRNGGCVDLRMHFGTWCRKGRTHFARMTCVENLEKIVLSCRLFQSSSINIINHNIIAFEQNSI